MEFGFERSSLGDFVAISACSAVLSVTTLNHENGSAPPSSVMELNFALGDLLFVSFVAISACSAVLPVTSLNHGNGSAPSV